MIYILREKVVNKTGLFLSIFLFSFIAVSQNQPAHSQYVSQLSDSILESKIEFSWNGGSLSEALNKIGTENQIKFSFANSRIDDIKTSSFNYNDIKLFDLLNLLFKNTGFNYVLVGRLIAVYKDETNFTNQEETVNSLVPNADTIKYKKKYPIYSPSASGYLSDYERKLLNKIYKEELKWAARHRKEQKRSKGDSSNTETVAAYKFTTRKEYRYFISISGGYLNNHIKWNDKTHLPWREDLQWSSEWENSFYPELQVGVQIKTFMFSTGIGIQKFSIENSFTKKIRKGPHTVREEYNILSIPLSVLYQKQWKNWWFGFGGGARLNLVSGNKAMSNQFEKYYSVTSRMGRYSENYKNIIPSLVGDASVGYSFSSKFILEAGISYNYSLSPIYENSLYSITNNSLVYRIGFYYRFNIYGRKNK